MNIEPLKSFLEEEMLLSDIINLINGLLDDYIDLIIEQQLESDIIRPDVRSKEYIYTLRRLREVLIECR